MDLYDDIKKILLSNSEIMKEKVSRLIGNLCKHSEYFYFYLQKEHIIEALMGLLNEESV